jgi:hypothetical protein
MLYVWIWLKISLIFNFQIMRMMMGATRRDVFDLLSSNLYLC